MTLDPIAEFRALYAQAEATDRAQLPDPSTMALATSGEDRQPSVRMVLLKGVDARGFVFYTNRHSQKARDLTENARAALCFYWPALDTQIRVEGTVTDVSDADADAYFASRARESQIGAWASNQSQPLDSWNELLASVRDVEARYNGQSVPRPPWWSGYRVRPERIEFWHAGAFRLHERRLYERSGDDWTVRLLNP